MSAAGIATGAAALTGAGGVVAALVSPLPLFVLAGFAVLVWLPIAVVLLTPVLSSDPDRCARATAVLDRLLAAVPGSRPVLPDPTAPPAPPSTATASSAATQAAFRRRWGRRPRGT